MGLNLAQTRTNTPELKSFLRPFLSIAKRLQTALILLPLHSKEIE